MDTRSPNGSSPQQPRSVKKHGIIKPISLAGPVEADIQRNTELEKFLIESGLYESKEGSSKREEVLGHITEIVKSWVKQLTRQKGLHRSDGGRSKCCHFHFWILPFRGAWTWG
ncbi:hypothetical protein ES288_D06G112400v1 [Gossypium darwinii]|uniref:Poly(A) polymerase nucleotidyltransferase domain-containing protein n=1 Tax=Gossypium darwinii TaxID=34276 RepID=A0A5D2C4E0_GOSDA|nr:hypothetical protein ES288_D06G112400v1 [Gossypium darwinii]